MKRTGTSTKLIAVTGLLSLGAGSHAQFKSFNPTNVVRQTAASGRIDPAVVNGGIFNHLTNGGYTIESGTTGVACIIGHTQAVWGSSSISELVVGAFVYQFPGSSLYTFIFSSAIGAFSFEGLGYDFFGSQEMCVDFYQRMTSLGSIGNTFDRSNVFVSSDLYAGDIYLYGAGYTRGYTSVDVNYTGTRFSSGAFRVGALAGGGNGESHVIGGVPEPGEWAIFGLLTSGLGGLVLRARRRKPE